MLTTKAHPVSGSITIAARFFSPTDDKGNLLVSGAVNGQQVMWLYLEVDSCSDLSNADFLGLNDPFVLVKVNGSTLGRTSVITKCCDPS